MTTSNTTSTTYRSLKELRSARIYACKSPNAGDRIFWTLDGPLTTAIFIMRDSHSPDSLEPYFQPTSDGGIWHPVSREPISEPKVSSITVNIEELDQWEWEWKECHRDHSEIGSEGEGLLYGALEDHDPAEDSDDEDHLLMCCGDSRPRNKKAKLVVTASESGDGFVTVHDYLSAVHPWLLSLRDDLVGASDVWDKTTNWSDLMVSYNSLETLMLNEKDIWIRRTAGMRGEVVAIHAAGGVSSYGI